MAQRKQVKEGGILINSKKRKLTTIVNSDKYTFIKQDSITRFEDLSNEVIYEIFDFFDFCDIHDTFSNLNTRFQNLLNDSIFSIKLNLSLTSGSVFHYYWTQIILLNQDRIKSLCLTDPSLVVIGVSSVSIWSKFTRLKILHFSNIKSTCFTVAVNRLIFLPCLTSLIIDGFDTSEDTSVIYKQVFRLPKLKYCQISTESNRFNKPLPIAMTKFSPIEYLVITHCLEFAEINAILSYVPQLRRFSVPCHVEHIQIHSYSPMLNTLTHVSLNVKAVILEQFELMIENLFRHVQILHISTEEHTMFLNENFWETLISSHLPDLRIFDIGIFYSTSNASFVDQYKTEIEAFYSPFWTVRQWFFEHHIYEEDNQWYFILYSRNPHRKKQYALYRQLKANAQKHLSL